MVGGCALDLLRCHVRHRPEHRAFLGEQSMRGLDRLIGGGGSRDPREAEIEHLDAPISREHHVGGLQIAVRDVLLVRRRQRVGERHGDLQEALDWQAGGRDECIQRLPLDELHRQKSDALSLLRRIDRHDVRVVEGGDGARLACEPLEVR
jgi:hypothetical protein